MEISSSDIPITTCIYLFQRSLEKSKSEITVQSGRVELSRVLLFPGLCGIPHNSGYVEFMIMWSFVKKLFYLCGFTVQKLHIIF